MKKRILSLALALTIIFAANQAAAASSEAYVEVVPPKYDEAYPFFDGLAAVMLDEKWGFIDKSGTEVIPLKYDNVGDFYEGLALVVLDNMVGFVDTSGTEVVPLIYSWARSFNDGMAAVNSGSYWGFVDKTGSEIVEPSISVGYDSVGDFSDGMAWVRLFGSMLFYVDKTGKQIHPYTTEHGAIIDGENNTATDVSTNIAVVDTFAEGLAAVNIDGEWGFIDVSGSVIMTIKYSNVGYFSEGLAAVELDGKWGYIDMTGSEVIPPKYDNVGSFSEGLAIVVINDQYGFIDKTGNEITPIKYDAAGNFSEGMAIVVINNKFGFIDKTGTEVVPLEYENAGRFSEGLAAVALDGKLGFIDMTGKEVILPKYDTVHNFSEGMAAVQLDDKWGFISITGAVATIPTPAPAPAPAPTPPPTQTGGITVTVNGTALTFGQPPITRNGRTLVPLRAIFEALDAVVDWNPVTQTVSAVRGNVTISLRIGSNILVINGESITLDVPARIVGGRILVPVRAIAESIGAEVGWEPTTRTVTITE